MSLSSVTRDKIQSSRECSQGVNVARASCERVCNNHDLRDPMSESFRLLFLCTGNSCRSQMAEGLARALLAPTIEPWSAGIEKHGLNPLAVEVMSEIGIDISTHRSKTLDELADVTFDAVITVCGHANETCPVFPRATRKLHKGFDDPPRLAANAASHEEALAHYRRVRDQIRAYVESLPQQLAVAPDV